MDGLLSWEWWIPSPAQTSFCLSCSGTYLSLVRESIICTWQLGLDVIRRPSSPERPPHDPSRWSSGMCSIQSLFVLPRRVLSWHSSYESSAQIQLSVHSECHVPWSRNPSRNSSIYQNQLWVQWCWIVCLLIILDFTTDEREVHKRFLEVITNHPLQWQVHGRVLRTKSLSNLDADFDLAFSRGFAFALSARFLGALPACNHCQPSSARCTGVPSPSDLRVCIYRGRTRYVARTAEPLHVLLYPLLIK